MRTHLLKAIMADSAKRDKLAAAKKKLKQFQSKRTPANSPAPTSRSGTSRSNEHNTGKKNGTTARSNSPKPQEINGPVHNSIPHSPVTSGLDQTQSAYSTPVGNSGTPASAERITESTERLQHLSRQINGLISESTAYLDNSSEDDTVGANGSTDLEVRNQQLASFLEQHARANEQLNKQLDELKLQNSRLHQNLDSERKGFEGRLKRELGSLKEQMQVHIQTIGILVAEKAELTSSLNQSQKGQEQKSEELEELQGRLKASRQRVADLERSFTAASSSGQKHEQLSKDYSKEVDRLKLELYKLNKSNEEFQQQNSEVQGKLQKKSSECANLETSIIELKGQLEMTQLHLQQLQNGTPESGEHRQQVDQLVTERAEQQAKLEQYEELFQRLTSERDQYQAYIDQMNQQTRHLQQQISSLSEEKDQLGRKSRELENIIDDLKTKQDSAAMGTMQAEKEASTLQQSVHDMSCQLEEYKEQYQIQIADNSQLSRMVTEKEEHIQELQLTVQRLEDSQVDSEQLLNSMQSDKTALSRAIAQNKELKSQLAELQNGFVKMSNDNMDLMTSVQTEQHTAKELAQRLGQQEEELKELREELGDKERTVQELRSRRPQSDSENHGIEDTEMKLKELQEHTPLLETLQRELTSAQDTINALSNQNSELRAQMLRSSSIASLDNDTSQVESLSASIRQLEGERDEVLKQLREEEVERQGVADKLEQLQQELAKQTPATLNGDVITKAQFEALQHAMQQLEGKFSKAMRDKADLMDKAEEYEHIIMQLQGETDTIGEYVALYQTQRSILKQRTVEKDSYISHMARERQEMQDKLGQLQALVMQLLGERQMLHSYHDNNNKAVAMAAASSRDTSQQQMQPHGNKSARPFGSNLDSSNLEDWPDYSSNSSSDDSDVEQIIGGHGDVTTKKVPGRRAHSTPLAPHSHHLQGKGTSDTTIDIPESPPAAEDRTAQRIMHLLTEIGNSNLIERSLIDDRNFLHCKYCTGRLWNV